MKLTRGSVIATVALAVCGLAIGLVVVRNAVLDHAIAVMKTGEFELAAPKLRILASIGDSTAQSLLGDLYAFGWGVPKDDETAIYWYRRAGTSEAAVSDQAAVAMYYVGKMYLGGSGIQRNDFEARKWFARSAQGGFAKASEELKQEPE